MLAYPAAAGLAPGGDHQRLRDFGPHLTERAQHRVTFVIDLAGEHGVQYTGPVPLNGTSASA